MSQQISDYMDSPWWRNMYQRSLIADPVNKNYSIFNQPGLTLPLVVESNPEYSVQMRRNNDGLNAYNVGGVSKFAASRMGNTHPSSPMVLGVGAPGRVGAPVRSSTGISGCSARTGDPSGCATVYLNQPLAPMEQGSRYNRLG